MYTKQYLDKYEKADPGLQEKLKKTENKILNHFCQSLKQGINPLNVAKISIKIKAGIWRDRLHAHVNNIDCRVVYVWDGKNKTITFYAFGTHKELGIG